MVLQHGAETTPDLYHDLPRLFAGEIEKGTTVDESDQRGKEAETDSPLSVVVGIALYAASD
jgi:hypothetical protein